MIKHIKNGYIHEKNLINSLELTAKKRAEERQITGGGKHAIDLELRKPNTDPKKLAETIDTLTKTLTIEEFEKIEKYVKTHKRNFMSLKLITDKLKTMRTNEKVNLEGLIHLNWLSEYIISWPGFKFVELDEKFGKEFSHINYSIGEKHAEFKQKIVNPLIDELQAWAKKIVNMKELLETKELEKVRNEILAKIEKTLLKLNVTTGEETWA